MELEATPKTVLPIAGPGEEAAMISADTLDNLEVNNLLLFKTHMKHYFANKVQSFKGGNLAHFFDKWKDITSDSEVLNCDVSRLSSLIFPHSPQGTWAQKGKHSTSLTHWL